MGSLAYEMGKNANIDKTAGLVGAGVSGAKWLGQKLGGKALNYGKSLVPQVGKKAPGVVTSTGSHGVRHGARSTASGFAHGISGGRWTPRGLAPADTAFRYGRGVGDAVARHPYMYAAAAGNGIPYYNPLGEEGNRFGTTGLGLIPERLQNLSFGVAGLSRKGIIDKLIGAYGAYQGVKDLSGGGGNPAEVPPGPQQPQMSYEDLVRMSAQQDRRGGFSSYPNPYEYREPTGQQTVSGLLPGQMGSRF